MCLCPMSSQAFDHGIHKCNEHVVEEIAEKNQIYGRRNHPARGSQLHLGT